MKIKKANKVRILVISNEFDFTTDYVCLELERRGLQYLRINRDKFENYSIKLDINKLKLEIEIEDNNYYSDETLLKSIYYRAPTFLRDIYQPNLIAKNQLYRTQWAAFVRDLAVYENITWVNNPVNTYKAENKILQLKYAGDVGFEIPKTIITNTNTLELDPNKYYIVKTIDPAILKIANKEAFIYTNIVKGAEIKMSYLNSSPTIIQEYLYPKIDLRITVVGKVLFGVKILKEGEGVEGDWRRNKTELTFEPFNLPKKIAQKCIKIVEKLGLKFGALDLARIEDKYYFLEINPTGEWAWLVDKSGLEIYKPICDILIGEN